MIEFDSDFHYIDDFQAIGNIYKLNGDEVLNMPYESCASVDISMLKSGNYIVRVGSYFGKFVKK